MSTHPRRTRRASGNDPQALGNELRPPSAERETRPPEVDEAVNADVDWRRASNLGAPPARKGFVQMWIRVEAFGRPDGRNYSRMYREGWRPRPLDTVPADFSPSTIKHGNQTVIGAEGMILCEMPKALAAKRRIFFKRRADAQMQAVEQNLMRVSRAGQQKGSFGPIEPTFKSESHTGKQAVIAED